MDADRRVRDFGACPVPEKRSDYVSENRQGQGRTVLAGAPAGVKRGGSCRWGLPPRARPAGPHKDLGKARACRRNASFRANQSENRMVDNACHHHLSVEFGICASRPQRKSANLLFDTCHPRRRVVRRRDAMSALRRSKQPVHAARRGRSLPDGAGDRECGQDGERHHGRVPVVQHPRTVGQRTEQHRDRVSQRLQRGGHVVRVGHLQQPNAVFVLDTCRVCGDWSAVLSTQRFCRSGRCGTVSGGWRFSAYRCCPLMPLVVPSPEDLT